MPRARRMGWWIAVPVGIALGLLLALGIDRAASPAAGAGGSEIALTVEQLRINQRIAQQGVKRANRANSRLDALAPGSAAGPAGPAGPGAARISFAGPVGTPARNVLALDGIVLRAACEAGPGGGASLVITGELAAPITLAGTASVDGGADPANPASTSLSNFQNSLAAGAATLGTVPADDGLYLRVVVNVLLIAPTRTVSVDLVEMADGINDRCSFDGVAVPSG
jgi:hypothetical protein